MIPVKIDSVVRSKKRKRIAIMVTERGEVVVRAPWRASDQTIHRLVKQYSEWIVKKKMEIESRPKIEPIPESLVHWYKKVAERVIAERSAALSRLTGYHPKSIKVTNAKTRWGSCSPEGNVRISWRLVMAPLEIIDYVIVHELVHLVEKNHAKRFWNKVGIFLPDYAERRKWLRTHGRKLG